MIAHIERELMILLEYDVMDRQGNAVPRREEFPDKHTAEVFYITAKNAIESQGGSVSKATYSTMGSKS